MTQPNKLIETIEKALKKATPGEWYVHEDEEETYIMAVDPNVNGRSVSVFGFDPEINFTSEDALLIANAPEWLRALLEERERMAEGWVIAESLVKQISGLHEELAAKDKVLESIATAEAFKSRGWFRGQARIILSQYKGESK